MNQWAVKLSSNNANALGSVRLLTDLQVCEQGDQLWMRGPETTCDENDAIISALPGERFDVLPDGQLRPIHQIVPRGHLPQGEWKPLKTWLEICLPTPAWTGELNNKVQLHLTRSTDEQTSELLLCRAADWNQFALSTSAIRLQRLQFAVADDSRVLIRGTPLPTIRGDFFVVCENVAVPAGWAWWPCVSADTVRRVFQVENAQDLILWQLCPAVSSGQKPAPSHFEVVPASAFVNASRSAVRASLKQATS